MPPADNPAPLALGQPRFRDTALARIAAAQGPVAAWQALVAQAGGDDTRLATALAEVDGDCAFAVADAAGRTWAGVDRFAQRTLCWRVIDGRVHVAERADAYLMYMELPGVDPRQVELHFEQNVLSIRGTKASSFDPKTDGELRLHARERVNGSFERNIRLPEFVDGDHIEATFRNGLLSIVVPKAQAAQPRKIEIRAATNG